MTKKELKQLIRESILEVEMDASPETQPQSSTDVTITFKGPGGEGSFVMDVELAKQFHEAIMNAVGESTPQPETPETPDQPETPEAPEAPKAPASPKM